MFDANNFSWHQSRFYCSYFQSTKRYSHIYIVRLELTLMCQPIDSASRSEGTKKPQSKSRDALQSRIQDKLTIASIIPTSLLNTPNSHQTSFFTHSHFHSVENEQRKKRKNHPMLYHAHEKCDGNSRQRERRIETET